MNNRRDFLKSSLAVTAGTVALGAIPAFASHSKATNIFAYTAEDPRRWAGKAGSHAPVVSVKGNMVTVETKHGMSSGHYIVKHSVVNSQGKVLGENVFFPDSKKAISTFEIKGSHKDLTALSFCNLHDLWATEFTI